ncbi:MAG: TfoX/Sxy family protein [Pseudomonadota bacterium]
MSGFTDYLPEVFERFGAISIRKMFGGYGIYHQGLMFALVTDDTLYLKADDENRRFFTAEGLGPFEYHKDGKTMQMSYYRAPDECLDDRDTAALWARRSYQAAARAHAAKSAAEVAKAARKKRGKPSRA